MGPPGPLGYHGGMNIPLRLLVAAVAAAGAAVALIARRPVKPPINSGSWSPADRQPTHL